MSNSPFLLESHFGSLAQFEQQIQQLAALANIDLSRYEIDHIAVRVNQIDTAQQWRSGLLTQGEILKESIVNGRPIALFTLNRPLAFLNQQIEIVELPFPKGKHYPQEGWEHIEMVFPMQENESVEAWCARTLKHFNLSENDQIDLKISQPEVIGEQLPNPTIAIMSRNVTYCNFCCLKIHPYAINKVVISESHSTF